VPPRHNSSVVYKKSQLAIAWQETTASAAENNTVLQTCSVMSKWSMMLMVVYALLGDKKSTTAMGSYSTVNTSQQLNASFHKILQPTRNAL